MIWSFFGARHGKGEHNGMGVVIKHCQHHYQLGRTGLYLMCTMDVDSLLATNLLLRAYSTFSKRQRHVETIRRKFHHMEIGDVEKTKDIIAKTILGTRNKTFQVIRCSKANHTLIHYRPLRCFCATCVYVECPQNYKNVEYNGGKWKTHIIMPRTCLPKD